MAEDELFTNDKRETLVVDVFNFFVAGCCSSVSPFSSDQERNRKLLNTNRILTFSVFSLEREPVQVQLFKK